MKKNKVMDFFSALGRSLMMPIAALAACGIILGVTAALLKTQVVEAVPFLQQPVVFYISIWCHNEPTDTANTEIGRAHV